MPEPCGVLQARGHWAEDAALHRCTFPIGPRNTWSNVAYPLVGLAVALGRPSSASVALAVALTVLGIGSALYHGFKTAWSNRLDWVGMYMVFGCLVVHAEVPGSTMAPWLMLVFGGAVAAYYTYELNAIDLNASMGVFLFLSLVPAVWGPTPHLLLAGIAFGLFLVAYGIWQLDVAHSKYTGLWGHAAWHGASALAIGLTYWSVTG